MPRVCVRVCERKEKERKETMNQRDVLLISLCRAHAGGNLMPVKMRHSALHFVARYILTLSGDSSISGPTAVVDFCPLLPGYGFCSDTFQCSFSFRQFVGCPSHAAEIVHRRPMTNA